MVTARADVGADDAAFSSINLVSRSWSSDPQFTPMRTGFPLSTAIFTIVWKFSSRCFVPTLPGLIRYFASIAAAGGYAASSLWPL